MQHILILLEEQKQIPTYEKKCNLSRRLAGADIRSNWTKAGIKMC